MRYQQRRVSYIVQKFIETGNYVGLEDFIMIIKDTAGSDVDFLFQMLVDAHVFNPDKMYDIWEYIEEERHKPSKKLVSKMTTIMKEGGLSIPTSMKQL